MGNTGAKDAKVEHNAPPLIESRSALEKGAKAAQHGSADGERSPPDSPTSAGDGTDYLRGPSLGHELMSDAGATTAQPTPIASPGHHRALFARKKLPGQQDSRPIPADLQSDDSQPNAAELAQTSGPASTVAQPPLEEVLPPLDSGATSDAAPSSIVVAGAFAQHRELCKLQVQRDTTQHAQRRDRF